MKRSKGRSIASWRRAAIALAGGAFAVGSLALLDQSPPPMRAGAPAAVHVQAAVQEPPVRRPVSTAHATGDGGIVAEPESMTPSGTVAHDTSVVARLKARYQSEDLELLAAVSRRTSGPASPAVHRLLTAARAGADDTELTRIIREEVQGPLVRHDCFEWLRRRRGDPRPKPPTLASRARTAPAR